MRRYSLMAVLGVAFVVGFAPAPLPRRERNKDDSTALFGTWEFEAWEMNGGKHGFSQYLELTPEKVHFVSIQGGSRVTYKFVIRPDFSPRGFQWIPDGGGGWIGSYRIEGDRLTMIFKSGSSWTDRPTDFNATHEYRFILRKKR